MELREGQLFIILSEDIHGIIKYKYAHITHGFCFNIIDTERGTPSKYDFWLAFSKLSDVVLTPIETL